jgi:hypothetical protein
VPTRTFPSAKSTQLINWLRPNLRWITVPSWIGSLIAHLALGMAIISLAKLPSCRRDIAGNGGEDFREVGIRQRTSSGEFATSKPAAANVSSETARQPQNPSQNPLASLPPVPLHLPETSNAPPVIGAGALPQLSSLDVQHLVRPLGGGAAAAGTSGSGERGSGEAGGTTFLGIHAVGKRFVYVIDRSFSMADDSALQAAKAELLASLQQLDEQQQFQIIFYNNEFTVLETRGGRFDVFNGTDVQRMKVAEQIREIRPAGGTRHLPALLEALKFRPDVIFLLTDGAAESALDHRDLEEIRQHNRHGSRIHCIEFGRSPTSQLGEAGNFLKDLARRNDGRYIYRNLTNGN